MDNELSCTQWWLVSLDMHGNPTLCDGSHQSRDGAEKAKTLFDRLGLSKSRRFAVAEIKLTEITGTHEPVNESAIAELAAIGLKPW